MAQQTETQALAALATFFGQQELDAANWRIDRWRDAQIIVEADPKVLYGKPVYFVLNGKVELLDLARTTPEVLYAQLSGA